MRLLYDKYDEVTRRSTTMEVDPENNELTIWHTQDTKPIVESAKALASNYDPYTRTDMTHVARIPMVMWQQLCRLGIAQDPVAFRKWLNSREARLLRTDDGRTL